MVTSRPSFRCSLGAVVCFYPLAPADSRSGSSVCRAFSVFLWPSWSFFLTESLTLLPAWLRLLWTRWSTSTEPGALSSKLAPHAPRAHANDPVRKRAAPALRIATRMLRCVALFTFLLLDAAADAPRRCCRACGPSCAAPRARLFLRTVHRNSWHSATTTTTCKSAAHGDDRLFEVNDAKS